MLINNRLTDITEKVALLSKSFFGYKLGSALLDESRFAFSFIIDSEKAKR